MKFWDNKGNIAVMAALTMPLVIGGAGLGVETGYWYYEQLHLQQAADAAAFAAALEQRAGAEEEDAAAGAEAAAATNGFDEDTDTIDVVTPSATASEESSVDVELTRTVPRAFSALFGDTPMLLRAKATAAYSTAANACVLALDKSAAPAVSFGGNSSADMAGCVIMSNSLAPNAVNFDGNSSVTAPCIMAVGGSVQGTNADVELTQCGAVMTGQPPAADPFRDMPYPAPGTCGAQVGDGLTPGCYTGGATLKNTVNLTSGIYVIDGGTLTINANALVTGSNVTFVLLNGANVFFNGNATINLSAPTTGTYKGMLFMGSRTSGAGGISTFNGTANSHLTGALYFPKQQIEYKGNFSGNGGCTQIVGATVKWTGNTHFNVDCTDYGLEPITAGAAVRLVG